MKQTNEKLNEYVKYVNELMSINDSMNFPEPDEILLRVLQLSLDSHLEVIDLYDHWTRRDTQDPDDSGIHLIKIYNPPTEHEDDEETDRYSRSKEFNYQIIEAINFTCELLSQIWNPNRTKLGFDDHPYATYTRHKLRDTFSTWIFSDHDSRNGYSANIFTRIDLSKSDHNWYITYFNQAC